MISLWNMLKGRIIAAIAAAILSALAMAGFDVVSEETITSVTVFATALVTFVQFLVYAFFHTLMTKRKLERGETAVENLPRLPY